MWDMAKRQSFNINVIYVVPVSHLKTGMQGCINIIITSLNRKKYLIITIIRLVRCGSCLSMPRPPLGTSKCCEAGTTATDLEVIHDWLESSLAAARVLLARTEQQMLSKSWQIVSDKSSMYDRL